MKKTRSLSICVPFYPWYREYDRTQEIFDVLIKGLNRCRDVENFELSIIDAGVLDVWGRGRIHHSREFEVKLANEFKGILKYKFDEESIHYDDKKVPRFWAAKAIDKSVRQSSSDKILIFGIDCFAPTDLLERYNKNVKDGKPWIIMSYNIPAFTKMEKGGSYSGWHTAKGIVGILKSDYNKVGGYDHKFIKDKSDSDFYVRMVKNYEIYVNKEDGFFHVNHPGSNAHRIWKIDNAQAS